MRYELIGWCFKAYCPTHVFPLKMRSWLPIYRKRQTLKICYTYDFMYVTMHIKVREGERGKVFQ